MSVQLHSYAQARCARWAIFCLWRADLLTPSSSPMKVKSWWRLWLANVRTQRAAPVMRRDPCPVDEIEAGITELCILQLPEKLRRAVAACYLSGGTADAKAAQLDCDRATYFRRLTRAYAELLGLFNDHEAGVLRVDIEQANAALQAERVAVPTPGAVNAAAKLKRPAMHGISHAVRSDLAPEKKAASGA